MPHSNNHDNTILSQLLNRDKIRNISHWISYFHKHPSFILSSFLCLADGDYVDYELRTRYVQSIDWVSISQHNNRTTTFWKSTTTMRGKAEQITSCFNFVK